MADEPPSDSDVRGWCRRGRHDECDGVLRSATGHHWWCRCSCHPEPPQHTDDERRAHEVWANG